MGGRLFLGGIPTKPDVDRLLAAVHPEAGGSITYADIEGVIGEKYGTARFNTVVNAWRNYLFRNQSLQTKRDGGAVHFLTAVEAHEVCRAGFRRTGRSMARVLAKAEAVDTDALTAQQQGSHNLLRRLARSQLEEIGKATRQIAAPKPAEGTTLRLAK